MRKTDSIPMHSLSGLDFFASETSIRFGEHQPDHRISFYAIVWFAENKGIHYLDFEAYPIRKNSVYLIGQNQVHSIPAKQLPQARTLVFSPEFFQRIEEPFLRHLFLPFENDGIQIPPDMIGPMEQLFSLIVLESGGEANQQLLLKYTTAFIMQLHRFSDRRFAIAAAEDVRIVQLFQLMESNYKEHTATDFYASRIGLTAKRANEILRLKAGVTISQLLAQLLLMEAKRELFHGKLTIKEIAYELGFSDQSYFSRFFKKHAGITPEQFREKERAYA